MPEAQYEIRPLNPPFPPRDRPRRSSYIFRSPWTKTLRLLNDEVWALDGRNIILQIDVRSGDIRRDGMLRAGAVTGEPGVRISFRTPTGTLVFGTDAYADWQSNVHAIALALGALRAVDRYGVTPHGEQFAGFRQLPAGVGANEVPSFPTTEAAAGYLTRLANDAGLEVTASDLLEVPAQLRRAWRVVAPVLHPDTGGSTGAFQRGEAAKRLVEADQKQRGLS